MRFSRAITAQLRTRSAVTASRPNDGDDVAGDRIDDQYFIADHDVVEAAPFRDDVDGVYGQRI